MTMTLQKLCNHCGSFHKLFTVPSASFRLIPQRNNWRKNYAKREAKKQIVHEYVGDSAKKTPIIYAWGTASSGALGNINRFIEIFC